MISAQEVQEEIDLILGSNLLAKTTIAKLDPQVAIRTLGHHTVPDGCANRQIDILLQKPKTSKGHVKAISLKSGCLHTLQDIFFPATSFPLGVSNN